MRRELDKEGLSPDREQRATHTGRLLLNVVLALLHVSGPPTLIRRKNKYAGFFGRERFLRSHWGSLAFFWFLVPFPKKSHKATKNPQWHHTYPSNHTINRAIWAAWSSHATPATLQKVPLTV
jgi:hypothetical protein